MHPCFFSSTLLFFSLLYSFRLSGTLLISTLLFSTLFYSNLISSTLLFSTLLTSSFLVLQCSVRFLLRNNLGAMHIESNVEASLFILVLMHPSLLFFSSLLFSSLLFSSLLSSPLLSSLLYLYAFSTFLLFTLYSSFCVPSTSSVSLGFLAHWCLGAIERYDKSW